MKKVICLFLTFALALSLCSCSKKPAETTPTTEALEVTEATVEAATEATEETTVAADATEETMAETEPNLEANGATGPTELGHQHSYSVIKIAPTCTARGYSSFTCTCGDKYYDAFVNATGHDWSDWETVKAATETSMGKEKRTCATCKGAETRDVPALVANHTHSYTPSVTTEPTCAKMGVRTYVCSCGAKYTENIAKLTTHTFKDKVVSPTCSSQGYTEHTCSVCSYSYKNNYTATTNHTKSDWYVAVEATTSSTGLKQRKCTVCNTILDTQVIPKLAQPSEPTEHIHTYSTIKVVPPTCTVDGYYINQCSGCGDTIQVPSYDIATGHNWQITSSVEATCTTNGSKTSSCSKCGGTKTDTIPATHDWVHHHEDATGHYEGTYVCHCGGWSGTDLSSHAAHVAAAGDGSENHAYYNNTYWVEDTPAKDWYTCSKCPATK